MEACLPSPLERVAAKALLLLASIPIPSRSSTSPPSSSFRIAGIFQRFRHELLSSYDGRFSQAEPIRRAQRSCDGSLLRRQAQEEKAIAQGGSSYLRTSLACVLRKIQANYLKICESELDLVGSISSGRRSAAVERGSGLELLKLIELQVMNCDRASKCSLVFFRGKKKESFAAALETGDSSLTSRDSSSACIGSHRRSSSSSRHDRTKPEVLRRLVNPSEFARLRPRAEAILKFLAAGRAPEHKIREAIGNSPDTSKALRMLVRQEEVQRWGRGGRKDPFIYAVSVTVRQLSDVDLF